MGQFRADLEETLLRLIAEHQPVPLGRLLALAKVTCHAARKRLRMLERAGYIRSVGQTHSQRWLLGQASAAFSRPVTAAPRWATPVGQHQPGHRISPEDEPRPVCDSWWMARTPDGFTAAARERQPLMAQATRIGYAGSTNDSARDRWSPGVKPRGED